MAKIEDYSQSLGITFTERQTAQFEQFLTELTDWNTRINLTAITEPKDIILKHFVDSLTLLKNIPEKCKSIIDIGSGAGFPGIPLAIMRPDCTVTLCESIRKKADFLEHVKNILKLRNVSVINERAEDVGHNNQHRERYDVAVARAVAFLPTLMEYLLPLVKTDGVSIAQKIHSDEEITSSANAIDTLGGKIEKIEPVSIPELQGRDIIVVKKIKKTPPDYPRLIGTPSKNPL